MMPLWALGVIITTNPFQGLKLAKLKRLRKLIKIVIITTNPFQGLKLSVRFTEIFRTLVIITTNPFQGLKQIYLGDAIKNGML